MKITDFVPQELVPLLTFLGKNDWLEFELNPNNTTAIRKQFPNVPFEHEAELELVDSADHLSLIQFYVVSKALAYGQKLIRPTYEQCAALEHVDLNIPFGDYQQPFPAIIVEIPEQYQQEMTDRFAIRCPRSAICCHEKQSGYIFNITDEQEETSVVDVLSPRSIYPSIEAAFNCGEVGEDIEQSKLIQRIGLNLCLMLTMKGVRQLGPADPDRIANLKKKVKGSKHRIAQALSKLRQQMPTLITFEQQIEFCVRENYGSSASDASAPTGRTYKPHWRKGHFRAQRIGRGRTQTKLIFIPPVMVNRQLFGGRPEDTKTVYQGKRSSKGQAKESA